MGLRILVLALGMATSVITARGLGPEGRGLVQLLLTLSVVAAALGGLSAELGIAHRFGHYFSERPATLASATYGSLVWGSVVGVATTAVTALVWTSPHGGPSSLLFLAVYTGLTLTTTWTQRALFLEGKPVRAAVVSTVEASVALIAILVATINGDLTVGVALTATATSSAVGTALSLVWSKARAKDLSVRTLARVLAGGAKFHFGQCALQLLIRQDVIVLSAFAGLASTGVYAVAVSLTAPMGVFATTIATTFLREQFHTEDSTAQQATVRLLALTTLLVVPGTVLLVLCGLPLIPLVWGHDFAGARAPLVLLAPGVIAMAVQRPIGNHFVRMGRARALNIRALVAEVVNLVLCLALIPHWGASGAAVASSVAYTVYAGITLSYWQADMRVSASDVIRAFRGVGVELVGKRRMSR